MVDLPTTEIIEPDILSSERARLIFKLRNRTPKSIIKVNNKKRPFYSTF